LLSLLGLKRLKLSVAVLELLPVSEKAEDEEV
jgi:hypothetical protein